MSVYFNIRQPKLVSRLTHVWTVDTNRNVSVYQSRSHKLKCQFHNRYKNKTENSFRIETFILTNRWHFLWAIPARFYVSFHLHNIHCRLQRDLNWERQGRRTRRPTIRPPLRPFIRRFTSQMLTHAFDSILWQNHDFWNAQLTSFSTPLRSPTGLHGKTLESLMKRHSAGLQSG